MAFGTSLLLIAVGAILTWAVHTSVSGIDINTVGVILLAVGGIGFIASLLVPSWRPWEYPRDTNGRW